MGPRFYRPSFWSMLDAETQAYLTIAGVSIQGDIRHPTPLFKSKSNSTWVLYLPSETPGMHVYSLEYWKHIVETQVIERLRDC